MSKKQYVYLAGPISEDETYENARWGWRKDLADRFHRHIIPLSPLRWTPPHLLAQKPTNWERGMVSPEGITYRDRSDVLRSDLVVVYFRDLPLEGRSSGTFIEVGWANAWNKPIVLIDKGFRHPMLDELASVRVTTIEEGAEMVNAFLGSGI